LNQRYDRRLFLSRTTRAVGGLTILSSPLLLWACGGDDDDSDAGSATTSGGTTGTTAAASATTSASTSSGGGGAAGTVATQFNWVPDVEWAAWYLGDANGHFAEYDVTSELGYGGPNTPATVQILAAGDGNVGIAGSELDITQANAEGSDFVIIGSMYQENPLGLTWLAGTTINSAEDLVDKRVGGPQGDQVPFEALLTINGLPTDQYEYIPMSFDPQPLVDGEMDVIISYVVNQPIQLRLQGHDVVAKTYSEFGLPSYGDILFASKAWIAENRDLLVRYLAGLIGGAEDNRADPVAVIPLLEDLGEDAEINLEYAEAANPEYIALMDSDFTDANGLLSVDPEKMANEVLPGLAAAGAADLPTADELLDITVLQEAHELRQ
jgi:ABC-type nitrate/sulfonate/bicarbonate transport system substrate-binding protein